ncbi:glutamate-5-semialdehyde dehydrogenase [Acetobacterium bakii]|uniref:Gamma-glutamyl phosphate reductase n=1 Tax=Acetobacterium bakii TaxID=52689 RepID=A0A0L6U0I0_9FIRM|nr:glutamate-5-semialdehyde dehydrogenase [Acetobacterium bakii]KNZ42026.1 gamma-glutamyl phosphate reductase [Acetobacterium bakii]
MQMEERGRIARDASIPLAATDGETRNAGLLAIAKGLKENTAAIIAANNADMARSQAENLGAPLLKRLTFDADKINDVIQGIHSLIELDNPLGATKMATQLDEGLDLYKVTCPIGVIGVIFESRPDAFIQISTLCLKSGNSVLLKGGREALETNRILCKTIQDATRTAGIPEGWIQNLETREDVTAMLALDQYIDLIIPRGSNDFVKYIMNNSNIPVMGHADGICHVYVHEDADLKQAVDIIVDSKTQYVAACNTLETLLVNEQAAATLLPLLKAALDNKEVRIKGDAAVRNIISAETATDEDWKTEYLDYILAIRIVPSLAAAIDHINTYGSGHTDVILSTTEAAAKTFMTLVDSAGVFWNCSTRFSDGFRFGFGAEVGISTAKLHARGPVGLDGLLSYKYKLLGHGQCVTDYASGKSHFTHLPSEEDCPI